MDRRTKQSFLMRSRQKEYKEKVKHAKNIIHKCFKKFNNPYVAFSGGKDSVVMLHLILEEYPNVKVWNWDHGSYLMPRNYQETIINNAIKQGVKKENLIVCSSNQLESPEARWDYMRWYKNFFSTLSNLINKYDWDCACIGLRMEESSARKLRAKNPFNFTVDKKCPQCYPVHDWSWEDIWACIISNNLPYLKHYDLYANYSGYDRTRLCTFFDKEFEHKNGVDGILMPEFRNR